MWGILFFVIALIVGVWLIWNGIQAIQKQDVTVRFPRIERNYKGIHAQIIGGWRIASGVFILPLFPLWLRIFATIIWLGGEVLLSRLIDDWHK